MRSKITGLTLMELLVVIAIIALLVALMLPVLQSARYRAKDSTCLSNMRQLLVAYNLYYQDYGQYPNGTRHILPYVKTHEIFGCPVAGDDPTMRTVGAIEGIPNLTYQYAGTFTEFELYTKLMAQIEPNFAILACIWHPESNLSSHDPFFAPWVRRGYIDGSVKTVKKRAPTNDELTTGPYCISGWLLYTNAPCPKEYYSRDICR